MIGHLQARRMTLQSISGRTFGVVSNCLERNINSGEAHFIRSRSVRHYLENVTARNVRSPPEDVRAHFS